jgi:hypothetical protein
LNYALSVFQIVEEVTKNKKSIIQYQYISEEVLSTLIF